MIYYQKTHHSSWKHHFNEEKIFQGVKPLSLPEVQNCNYDQCFADLREMNYSHLEVKDTEEQYILLEQEKKQSLEHLLLSHR